MTPNGSPPAHLYIHIPFCPRVCPYCGFHVTPVNKGLAQRFLDRLLDELRGIPKGPAWSTIYFGGGTPTALSAEMLDRLLVGIAENPWDSSVEVSVECNPGTLSLQKAAVLVAHGVNRFSVGAQSFDGAVLRSLGRTHSVATIHQCIETARHAGCANLNVDLIFGVPGQTLESWRATLQTALALKLNHISSYGLTYEEDTRFFERFQGGALVPNPELEAAMYHQAREMLGGAGYVQYEVSNYAQPGFECRHNLAYWRGADYWGVGPSAVSTIRGVRRRNRRMDAGGSWAVEETESLDARTRAGERMALGLRTNEGVEVEGFVRDFGFSPLDRWPKEIDRLVEYGLMLVRGEGAGRVRKRLCLTERGLAVADEVATEFV